MALVNPLSPAARPLSVQAAKLGNRPKKPYYIVGHPYATLLSSNTAVTRSGQIFKVAQVNALSGVGLGSTNPTNTYIPTK